MMDVKATAEEFVNAFNSGDLDKAASYLAEDFKFSGPVPEPVGAAEYLGLSRAMRAGCPDLQYNFKITGVEGDTVKTTSQLTGTHTADLDLSGMGMSVIPASGMSFSNPLEHGEVTFEGGKVTSIYITPQEGGGLMGMLTQLGVEMPAR